MKYFDIYGENYYLRFNNNKKYFSKFGIITGIISFINFGIYIIIQINEIFSHKKFTIISNRKKSELIKVNVKNINFILSINNEYLEYINLNSSYFDIKLNYNIYNFQNMNFTQEEIKGKLVNDSLYLKHFDLDKNYYLQGNLGQGFMSFLSITIDKCKNNNCMKEKEINEVIEKSSLLIIYNEINIDNFNYSNPLQMNFKIEIIPLSKYYNKIFNYYFEQKYFISENGIFSKKIIHFITIFQKNLI